MNRLLILLFFSFSISVLKAQSTLVNVEESLFEMAKDALKKHDYKRALSLLQSAKDNGYRIDSISKYKERILFLSTEEDRLKRAIKLFGCNRYQDSKDVFDSISNEYYLDSFDLKIRSTCKERVSEINQGRAISRELSQFMNLNKDLIEINPYYAESFSNGYFKCKIGAITCFLSKKGSFIPGQNARETFDSNLFIISEKRINDYYYSPEYLGKVSSLVLYNSYNQFLRSDSNTKYIPYSNYKYDNIWQKYNGMAKVKCNGLIGYLNSDGKLVIECKYKDGGNYSDGLIKVSNGKKWGYIDSLGNQRIEFKYKYCEDFSEGFAAVKKGNKYGYIDKNGEWKIKPIFDGAWNFQNGLAAVRIKAKWFFINYYGENVFNQNFPEIGRSSVFGHGFLEGFANVRIYFEKDGKQVESKWGFIDSKGNRLTPFIYDCANSFHNGVAVIARDGYRYGYIDISGKEIISPIYEEAFDFNEDIGLVRKDGYYGFVDKYGVSTFNLKSKENEK